MIEQVSFEPDDLLEINPLYMLRWEDTQNAYVLLYPEGVVKLNDTAGEILKRCTGDKTVSQIIEELKEQYSASGPEAGPEIEKSAHKFFEVSHAKGWIRHKG